VKLLSVYLLIAWRGALGAVGFAGGGCVFHLLISINMQLHVFPLQHAAFPFVAAAFQSFHRLMLHLCVVRACPLTGLAPPLSFLLAPFRPLGASPALLYPEAWNPSRVSNNYQFCVSLYIL